MVAFFVSCFMYCIYYVLKLDSLMLALQESIIPDLKNQLLPFVLRKTDTGRIFVLSSL